MPGDEQSTHGHVLTANQLSIPVARTYFVDKQMVRAVDLHVRGSLIRQMTKQQRAARSPHAAQLHVQLVSRSWGRCRKVSPVASSLYRQLAGPPVPPVFMKKEAKRDQKDSGNVHGTLTKLPVSNPPIPCGLDSRAPITGALAACTNRQRRPPLASGDSVSPPAAELEAVVAVAHTIASSCSPGKAQHASTRCMVDTVMMRCRQSDPAGFKKLFCFISDVDRCPEPVKSCSCCHHLVFLSCAQRR